MSDERAVEVIASVLWIPGQAPHVLVALRAEGFDLYQPEKMLRIGWCPRGTGHFDMPEPDGNADYGICGSKWSHSALMFPWVPVPSDPPEETKSPGDNPRA